MSRFIDADAFKWEMYQAAFESDTDLQRWDSGCWIRYKLFEEILNKQQTADVVPKEKFLKLLENANILADAVREYQRLYESEEGVE